VQLLWKTAKSEAWPDRTWSSINIIVITNQDSTSSRLLLGSSYAPHVLNHFARERVARREVRYEYCRTECMIADYLTKAVSEHKFLLCSAGMGLSA
jgi:hypothetical protein